MKHLIMGTAGHVDHGKTALLKILTGYDCDTHKEEKKRGITIHLGFSHLNISKENTISIIDVPGHKDFVHTMVGGASGIDFVLFVIAADSGIMPQTIEHLQILKILGVKYGFVVLTKIDLVGKDLIEFVKEDIKKFVKGSFLENFPIIEVSSKTGEGFEILKSEIIELTEKIKNRPSSGVFRMYIDRIFTMKGFGTIVNGSVIDGSIDLNSKLYLLPNEGKELRIRQMQRHSKQVEVIKAGDRASINIVGLEKKNFKRGMIISDTKINSTDIIDAKIEIFKNTKTFKLWNKVIFHSGTFEKQAKIHIINKDKLVAGERAIVQIFLSEPNVFLHGDRFVLRNTSSDKTLGGGEIIDPHPLHHRRRPEKLINKITKIATGKISEIIASEVRKFNRVITDSDISNKLNVSNKVIKDALVKSLPKDIIKFNNEESYFLLSKRIFEKYRKIIINIIKKYKEKNPLSSQGISFEKLRGEINFKKASSEQELLKYILEFSLKEKKLKIVKDTWILYDDIDFLDEKMEKNISFFSDFFESFNMKIPLHNNIKDAAYKRNIDENTVKQILKVLIENKKIKKIDNSYIHSNIINTCKDRLITKYGYDDSGFTVAQFRDLVKGNRKICLLLLNLFDDEGLTLRKGDIRVIRQSKISKEDGE